MASLHTSVTGQEGSDSTQKVKYNLGEDETNHDQKLAGLLTAASSLGIQIYDGPTVHEAMHDEQKLGDFCKTIGISLKALLKIGARMNDRLLGADPLSRDPTAPALSQDEPSTYRSEGPTWHNNSCAFDTLVWLCKQLHMGNTVEDYALNYGGLQTLTPPTFVLREIVRLPGWEKFTGGQKKELVAILRGVCLAWNPNITKSLDGTPHYTSLMMLWHNLVINLPQTTYEMENIESCGSVWKARRAEPRCAVDPVDNPQSRGQASAKQIIQNALDDHFLHYRPPPRPCSDCMQNHTRLPALVGKPPSTLAVGKLPINVAQLRAEHDEPDTFRSVVLRCKVRSDDSLADFATHYDLKAVVYIHAEHFTGEFHVSRSEILRYDGRLKSIAQSTSFAAHESDDAQVAALLYRIRKT